MDCAAGRGGRGVGASHGVAAAPRRRAAHAPAQTANRSVARRTARPRLAVTQAACSGRAHLRGLQAAVLQVRAAGAGPLDGDRPAAARRLRLGGAQGGPQPGIVLQQRVQRQVVEPAFVQHGGFLRRACMTARGCESGPGMGSILGQRAEEVKTPGAEAHRCHVRTTSLDAAGFEPWVRIPLGQARNALGRQRRVLNTPQPTPTFMASTLTLQALAAHTGQGRAIR